MKCNKDKKDQGHTSYFPNCESTKLWYFYKFTSQQKG